MGLFDNPGGIDWGQIASGMQTPDPNDPNFQQRFGAAFPQTGAAAPAPPPMPVAGQSPISPEALAATAAARGVPPPAADIAPPYRLDSTATDQWRNSPDSMGPGGSDVGAALTGKTIGAPTDIRTDTQKTAEAAPTDVSAKAKDPKQGAFAEALRGVKAPPAPEIQRLGTPAAPKITGSLKGGELMALLQTLNAGGGGAGLTLPSTLGQAIRRG